VNDNVVKFKPVEIGENYRFDPDEILEAAKGRPFGRLVIIGDLPDGEIYVAGTANAGESMVLMERAKLQIIGK
jgi:hypothetical protein